MKKMLVVYNDADVSVFLNRFFSERHFWVMSIRDHQEALFLCQKEKFDVIVLDVNTDKVGAFDIIENIASLHAEVNIVILSNSTDQDNIDKAYSLGASRYINKPLVLEELEVAVMK